MPGILDELNILFNESTVFHGLDLGTYSSIWAYKRKDSSPKTVDYAESNRGGIPSLFWLSPNGKEYVADEVKNNNGIIEDPLGVCSSVKMKLSDSSIKLHDKSYLPSEILKKIIERVIKVSERDLQREFVDLNCDGLVVGVPALFTAAEKGTILSALESVTNSNKIRLVPEPILAAISSNYYSSNHDKPTLVYDLGAGTFDVCVLIPNNNINLKNPFPYIVAKADGLRIAGDIFDEKMVELLISKLEKSPGTLNVNNLKDKKHADRRLLRDTAREIKETLSTQESLTKPIMDSGSGAGRVHIERSEYEKEIQAELRQTVNLSYKVLMDSNLGSNPDINIVLVGGSSNIPLVMKMIVEKFNWISRNSITQKFPEKAVALGAAIFAEMPNFVDNTPVPFSYAVDTFVTSLDKHALDVIVPRGAKLPSTVKAVYSPLRENQTALFFEIYELYPSEEKEYYDLNEGNKTQYNFKHDFGKEVPKSTSVELTATLTSDGVLEITTNDFGVSDKSIQKHRIEFKY